MSVNSFSVNEGISALTSEFEIIVMESLQKLSDLQGQIEGNIRAVSNFMSHLKSHIQRHIENGRVLKIDILSGLVTDGLEMAEETILTNKTVLMILSTFVNISAPVRTVLTSDEIDTLPIKGDAIAGSEFRAKLKAILEMESNGSASHFFQLVILENSIIDLLVDNAIMKSPAAKFINEMFNLPSLQVAIEKSMQLMSNLQNRIYGDAEAASKFVDKIKTDIQEVIAAGTKAPAIVIGWCIWHNLELAIGNNIVTNTVAQRILSIGNALEDRLRYEEIEQLDIKGDPVAAAKFKSTMKGLWQLFKNGVVDSAATMRGLNTAVLNLLASNRIIEFSAAAELKNFFMA